MVKLRRWSGAVVGVAASAMAAGVLAVACGGGDDTGSAVDASVDASADAAKEASVGVDAAKDATATDATATDATGDVTVTDATADVTMVTVTDAGPDGEANDAAHDGGGGADAGDAAGDAAIVDGGVDSAAALVAFPGQVAQALCAKYQSACSVLDAGPFDTQKCLSSTTISGYSTTLLGTAGLLDSGLLVLDPARAQKCLNDIAAIDSTANLLTSGAHIATLDDCTAAVFGTLEAGAPCTATILCGNDEFCNAPTDGGAALCEPLSGDGGECSFANGATANYGTSEQACSFRASGNTDLRCANGTLTSPPATLPSNSWVCAPANATGGNCNFNQDCVSQLCAAGTPRLCTDSIAFMTLTACASYAPDGG